MRNILEFNGGITDNYLSPAKAGVDTWNTYTHGSARFRNEPGSQPQARIPSTSGPRLTYNVQYYSHDTRRLMAPREFEFAASKAQEALSKPAPAQLGSLGGRNPDVVRYDQSGLRTAMTTNWTALNKAIAKAQPNHLPMSAEAKETFSGDKSAKESLEKQGIYFKEAGVPRSKMINAWSYRHADQW